jgi:hypothetical protein
MYPIGSSSERSQAAADKQFEQERWERLKHEPVRSAQQRAAAVEAVARLAEREAGQKATGLGSPAMTKRLVAKALAAVLAIDVDAPAEPEPAVSLEPAQVEESEDQRLARERWNDLGSGRAQPMSTRQIDFRPRTGVWTSRTRRYGGPWSKRRVIAVSRPAPRQPATSHPVRLHGPRSRARHRPRGDRGPPAESDDDVDGEPLRRVGLRHVAPAFRGAAPPAASGVRKVALR